MNACTRIDSIASRVNGRFILFSFIFIFSATLFAQDENTIYDCFGCTEQQRKFANGLHYSNGNLDMPEILADPKFNPNFTFRVRYADKTVRVFFRITTTVKDIESYTPFSFLASRDFPAKFTSIDKLIAKTQFNFWDNFETLIQMTYPVNKSERLDDIMPLLPEDVKQAIIINSMIEYKPEIINYAIAAGYLEKKFLPVNLVRPKPERTSFNRNDKEYAKWLFYEVPEDISILSRPLKDSSFFELLFQNFPVYYVDYLGTYAHRNNDNGFMQLLGLLDSAGFTNYPDFINRQTMGHGEIFLRLYSYYNHGQFSQHALLSAMEERDTALVRMAFTLGANQFYDERIPGRIAHVARMSGTANVFYIETDSANVIVTTAEEIDTGRSRILYIDQMKTEPEFMGTYRDRYYYAFPAGDSIRIYSDDNGFRHEKSIPGESAKYCHDYVFQKDYYGRLLVFSEGKTSSYQVPSWNLAASIDTNLEDSNWDFVYNSGFNTVIKRGYRSYEIIEVSEGGFTRTAVRREIKRLAGPYFIFEKKPGSGLFGIVEIRGAKQKVILAPKYDSIELVKYKFIGFRATRKGVQTIYSLKGKKVTDPEALKEIEVIDKEYYRFTEAIYYMR